MLLLITTGKTTPASGARAAPDSARGADSAGPRGAGAPPRHRAANAGGPGELGPFLGGKHG